MNYYELLISFALAFIIGFLCGFIMMLNIYHKFGTWKIVKSTRNAERVGEVTEKPGIASGITKRFTDQGGANIDLICTVEKIDEKEYVENVRKKQNKAYLYTRHK